jgi:hypothetical protein
LVVGMASLVVALALLVGQDDSHPDDGEVTVSQIRNDDPDDTYQIIGPLRALNDSGEGWLQVDALPVGERTARTPLLTATIHYDDMDISMDCRTPRGWMWSGRTEPTELLSECPSIVFLDSISSVSLEPWD